MQNNTATPCKFLKAEEVAERLSCAKSTIYRLAQIGKIPSIGIGATGVRFDFDKVLEALRRKPN